MVLFNFIQPAIARGQIYNPCNNAYFSTSARNTGGAACPIGSHRRSGNWRWTVRDFRKNAPTKTLPENSSASVLSWRRKPQSWRGFTRSSRRHRAPQLAASLISRANAARPGHFLFDQFRAPFRSLGTWLPPGLSPSCRSGDLGQLPAAIAAEQNFILSRSRGDNAQGPNPEPARGTWIILQGDGEECS